MTLVLEHTLHSEGFPPGSHGRGSGKDNNWQGVAEKVNAISLDLNGRPIGSRVSLSQIARRHESHAGCKSLPPCLKDRRDEKCHRTQTSLYGQQSAPSLMSCRMEKGLPSRRKTLPDALTFNVVIHSTASGENMGSIVEEGITPPTGKAAGLRDYPMLPYNLHSPANEVFFSQSGASAPVMITAVRGGGVYNRESASTLTDSVKQYNRWSKEAGQREGGDGGLRTESVECSWPDSRKIPAQHLVTDCPNHFMI